MVDKDEEVDIIEIDLKKVLLGETGKKKPKAKAKAKAKAKTKSKKSKDDMELTTARGGSTLPLSMIVASAEDIAQYEQKTKEAKGQAGKSYKMTETYKAGEVISHKSFGTGYVIGDSGLNKVEVLFKAGRKLLVMGAGKE